MFYYLLVAVLMFTGLYMGITAVLYPHSSRIGQKQVRQLGRWKTQKMNFWDVSFIQKFVNFLSKFVYMDQLSASELEKKLHRANMNVTPKQYTARKYAVGIFALVTVSLCALLQSSIGILIFLLISLFLFIDISSTLSSRIKKRDAEISAEMPRFIRTICRNLHSNRDIYGIIESYQKVAGPTLKKELGILLSHMRTGGYAQAIQAFQVRIGTDEAFRLCSALIEIDRGVDQTSTLEHLADDMTIKLKHDIQKTLSTRPRKMRLTYLPAIGIAVVMVIYILANYLLTMLGSIW